MERAEVDEHAAQTGQAEPEKRLVAGQAQPPDVAEKLHQTVDAELGLAVLAVAEINGFLDDPGPGVQQAMQQHHLEGVALHGDVADLGVPQRRGADGLEARGAIPHPPDAGDPPRQPVAPARQLPPPDVPLRVDAAAGYVTAADRHVGALGHALQQPARIRRVVRKIGVHLHDDLGPEFLQGVHHAAHVGVPQPPALTLEQAHPFVPGGNLPHQRPRAVRALVVHDQEPRLRLRVQRRQPLQQRRHVSRFVVGGDDKANTRPRVALAHPVPSIMRPALVVFDV